MRPPAASPTLLDHYRSMVRVRTFELLQLKLWEEGAISGELHLGTGEEAVAAGVVAHLREGDALALDHRPTPLMLLRGVDPVLMIREMLGRSDGLCGGAGGHMHLFSRLHLVASSGIVGAAVPTGCGFALAATQLRPEAIAIATLGDGAMNQGMVLEGLNLAAVWRLPLVLVCKDNDWAITTESHAVTAGDLLARAEAFGVRARVTDGGDPESVHGEVGELIEAARAGGGPGFLLARCPRLDGHMAGLLMDRLANRPFREGGELLAEIGAAAVSRGGRLRDRAASVTAMSRGLARTRRDRRGNREDPLERARKRLGRAEAEHVEKEVAAEFQRVREVALRAPAVGGEP